MRGGETGGGAVLVTQGNEAHDVMAIQQRVGVASCQLKHVLEKLFLIRSPCCCLPPVF